MQGGDRQGILLTPYRNYLGDSVIGAWQWLDEHRLGLAVEVGESEAYKPIAILNTQLAVMVLTLAVALFLGPLLPGILWRRVVLVKSGQTVGAYRIERKLGEGGMAEVFLGRHERLGRPAAVKIVKGGQREEIEQRFEREARLLASLRQRLPSSPSQPVRPRHAPSTTSSCSPANASVGAPRPCASCCPILGS